MWPKWREFAGLAVRQDDSVPRPCHRRWKPGTRQTRRGSPALNFRLLHLGVTRNLEGSKADLGTKMHEAEHAGRYVMFKLYFDFG